MNEPGHILRVVSYNVRSLRGGLGPIAELLRPLHPDIVLVQDAPWRLRWRTPCSELARSLGMYFVAGGNETAGNIVLCTMRVSLDEQWAVRYPLVPGHQLRGAVLARCSVGGASLVVAGSKLAPEPAERAVQAALLAATLADVSGPLVLAGDLADPADGASGRLVDTAIAADGVVTDEPGPGTGSPLLADGAQARPGDSAVATAARRPGVIFASPQLRVLDHRVVASSAGGPAAIVADLVLRAGPTHE